jgi:hypothetical protein
LNLSSLCCQLKLLIQNQLLESLFWLLCYQLKEVHLSGIFVSPCQCGKLTMWMMQQPLIQRVCRENLWITRKCLFLNFYAHQLKKENNKWYMFSLLSDDSDDFSAWNLTYGHESILEFKTKYKKMYFSSFFKSGKVYGGWCWWMHSFWKFSICFLLILIWS